MRDASLPRGPWAQRPAPLRSLRSRFRFSEIAQRSFNDGAGVAKDADNLTPFRAGRGTKKIRILNVRSGGILNVHSGGFCGCGFGGNCPSWGFVKIPDFFVCVGFLTVGVGF